MPSATDRDLVDRFTGSGDEDAFGELYARHVHRVHRIVARVLGPLGEVDDAVQEIFVQVYRSLDRFRGECRFTTWLYRVAVNVTTSALRRRTRDPVDLADRPPDPEPGDRLDAREDVLALYRALDELPERSRVAFVLFELEGMPLDEVAETTGVPLQTAAARLRRARVALARTLERGPATGEPAVLTRGGKP
ncbi:MAG TPA: sigma-70 family RNA polymerase sigma factor [Anaeromyxobacter sp.]